MNDYEKTGIVRWMLFPLRAVLVMPLVLTSACAFTTGHVDLAYAPTTTASRVATAESARVAVEVIDKRPTKIVGEKINGFGMKTADIESNSDVAATLTQAFVTELRGRGYVEGAGGSLVQVSLANFQNQFTVGLLSGHASATIGMDVTVKQPDGAAVFNHYFSGESKDWVMVTGEDNAQKMLNAAMQDVVGKVFADNKFIEALNKH